MPKKYLKKSVEHIYTEDILNPNYNEINQRFDGTIEYVTRGDSNNATDVYRPTLEDIKGNIEFRHLSFKYPDGEYEALLQATLDLMKAEDYEIHSGIYSNKYLRSSITILL